MDRLMLVDVFGLVYRAFFALPPLSTRKGVPVQAAYGFTQMLNRLLQEENPSHVVACWDRGLPPERLARFLDYKAQRSAMPEDLRPQFEWVRRILGVWRIPIVELDQQEADDLIATLAAQARRKEIATLVVTGDLDLLQVVAPGVTALVTRRGISELARYGVEEVRQRFGLEPGQLADYRGLKGDPSDNLPGIPGVGEKTAARLLQAAGSLDRLLADPSLAGSEKLKQLVIQHGEQARACRDVALLKADLPVELDLSCCRRQPADHDELYRLYSELEFKALLSQVAPASSARVVDNLQEGVWSAWDCTQPLSQGRVALALMGERLGMADSAPRGWEILPEQLPKLTGWTGFDSKSLIRWLKQQGVDPGPCQDDPMLAAHLLDPSRSFTHLPDLAYAYLDRLVDSHPGAWAAATWSLVPILRKILEERQQLALYSDLEVPLARVLAEMESAGVGVDTGLLQQVGGEMDDLLEALQEEVYQLADEEFNIGSPQQLGVILFEKLQLPGGKRNKTGWATGAEVLQSLEHPICRKILEFREVSKLKNTYVDAIPQLVEADGRLRTRFHQTATATGRLSSSHPNLQNIPVRTALGRRIRRAFVASPGHMLLCADYDQIELRLMAHLSQDKCMLEAFARGEDIHDFTARQIFHLGQQPATAQQRRVAKSVNFGLLYGMSEFGLAQRLDIPKAQAREMIQAYFARFPSIKSYIKEVIQAGRQQGYVSTLLGRRRYMPELRSSNFVQRSAAEREATNAPIQGSAADLMKLAMVSLAPGLKDYSARLLLQIHDELIFEVPASQVKELGRYVRGKLVEAYPLRVPLAASVKAGSNWCEVDTLVL